MRALIGLCIYTEEGICFSPVEKMSHFLCWRQLSVTSLLIWNILCVDSPRWNIRLLAVKHTINLQSHKRQVLRAAHTDSGRQLCQNCFASFKKKDVRSKERNVFLREGESFTLKKTPFHMGSRKANKKSQSCLPCKKCRKIYQRFIKSP